MQPLWKTVWRFLKKLKIELPCDPAIPFLGRYPKKRKTVIQKDTCTPMFMAVLFTIARVWQQPVSINTWMNKDVVCIHVHTHTHTRILLSRKKEQNIAEQMDGPGGYCAYWNKPDVERQILYVTTYMCNLNIEIIEYDEKKLPWERLNSIPLCVYSTFYLPIHVWWTYGLLICKLC